MKKLFLLLILSFFSVQGLAGDCPDGSEPVKSISADGTYFVFNCEGSASTSSNTFELQNPDRYCPSVILPNDVASGAKFGVCLADKTAFKEYGLQVVDKKDGHPVRAGNNSLRFELRDGDCNNPPPPKWNDCKTDRERFELSGHNMYSGEEWWYAWSIFIPKDFINIYPALLDLGQFHLEPTPEGDPCCNLMFKNGVGGYNLENPIKNFEPHQLLTHSEMAGRWNDILINFKLSNKNNGFIKLWLNKKLVYEYTGPTMTKNTEFVYNKFGIYRGGLSRYLNHKNFSTEVEACFENNGASKELINATKKGGHSQVLGLGANSQSFKIYNQCKHLYKIKLPTQVVCYDEVRVGKSKEQVVGNLPQKELEKEQEAKKAREQEEQEAKKAREQEQLLAEIPIYERNDEALNLALDKVDFIETGSFKLERKREYLKPYQMHKGFIDGDLKTKGSSTIKFRSLIYKYADAQEQKLVIHTDDQTISPLKRHKDPLEKKCGLWVMQYGWLGFISKTNSIKNAKNQQCIYDYYKEANDKEAFELFQAVLGGTDSILNYLEENVER